MKIKQRNTSGYLSIAAVVISIIFFFLPISIGSDVVIIALFSLVGIGFAIYSKELRFILAGIILNTTMLAMAYLLWIGAGFSGL